MISGRFQPHNLPHDATLPESPQRGQAWAFDLPGCAIHVDDARADVHVDESTIVIVAGAPRFDDNAQAELARKAGPAAACAALYERHGEQTPITVKGSFAIVVIDLRARRMLLAVDRFGVESLCYRHRGDTLYFADRADLVDGADVRHLDPQGLFDYLYFHVIPAPRTVFRDVWRLPARMRLTFDGQHVVQNAQWTPEFVESERRPFAALAQEFRSIIETAVRNEAAGNAAGCFLSGGTDSSTVAGMLTQVLGAPAKTFSIGFDAQGYDEMEFARIAATRFGTEHHEYYLTREELLRNIPLVAAHYDQPFGNSSAAAAYQCALVAKSHGVSKLLAGDGGDELFGGNTRYAKQRVFEAYGLVPGFLRAGAIEPLLLRVPGVRALPVLRKAASYVEQALVPMPDRMNMYNLLARLGLTEVLEADFLAQIDVDGPARQQRDVYNETRPSHALVNRMLAYDWKYTLADNDLPKVCGSVHLAGLRVGFPLLADELVDFSLRLDPELKLKGLKLRYFFKEALRGFLPDEIITKKKHGFGLPFGVWAIEHPGLRSLAFDSLASLRSRGVVRGQFIDALRDRLLPEHPGYYGEMVWILMMLEQWLSASKQRAAQPAPATLPAV